MSGIEVPTPADLPGAVGRSATGEWLTIDQDRIDLFADATDDHQWIHVDPERAAAGPFGATVAHGFLTLSLIPPLTTGLLVVGETGMVVNYGLDRVRFIQPVHPGSRVRAVTTVTGAEPTPNGVRVHQATTIEIEGSERPAVVVDMIALYVPA
jgi:acyl dehydratase